MGSADFRRNHYAPEWYQKGFLSAAAKEQKFFYLDKQPEVVTASNGKRYTRNDVMRWGPDSCFKETDLYTTKFGTWESTEIEERFFGNWMTGAKRLLSSSPGSRTQTLIPAHFRTLLPT